MTRRPHLLYTAWGFPPSRAGGVYRALATVNAFVDRGWDVTVLTAPRDTFLGSTGGDEALEARIRPEVQIERVPVSTPAFSSDLSVWGRARARYPEIWSALDWRHDLVAFPERAYGRWRPALERTAKRVHAAHPIDAVIGTANPHVDFIPGWLLHREFGIPYVMDYRDAWRLDVFSGRTLHSEHSRVGRWERRLQQSAAEIWFVNDPIEKWHAQRNPGAADRMKVVANGFDEYELPLRVPVRQERGRGLRFGYIGTISENVPIRELLAGWQRARQESETIRDAELIIYGYVGHFGATGSAGDVLAAAGDHGVRLAGAVSKSTIGGVYQNLDVLVLALGTGRYVTSGKVFEYAATGIPVVSVHDPTNAATDVLSSSPSWAPARSLSPEHISQALVAAAARSLAETAEERSATQEWARQFERNRQLAPRIDALRAQVRSDE